MTYVCTVEDVNGFMAELTDLTYRYPLGTPSDWLPAGNAVLLVYPDDTKELIAVECQAQIGLETAHATYRGSFDTEEWNAFLEKWMQ